jgi:hypothetical protein
MSTAMRTAQIADESTVFQNVVFASMEVGSSSGDHGINLNMTYALGMAPMRKSR